MSLSKILLFDYASELARHIITLVLIVWNFRLFKHNEQLSKFNMDLISLELIERPELEVNIDFDEASREWRRNKRYTGNGTFEYKKERCKPKFDKLEIIHPEEIYTGIEKHTHLSPPPAPRHRYVETPTHRYNTRLAAKNKKMKQ